ncbi:uncharacterized protein LOC119079119 [Bradysia coprophila]|uniref:uncharacterized protein LOC119079119 n=1 Tax=Bradysia coprophila TaxID=38358 RepID=UPI00187DD549|nr:uncharacterized protein LOC119079119 [Bradysia coprophila]
MNTDDLSNISDCQDVGDDLYEELSQAVELSNISHDDYAHLLDEIIPADDLSNISGSHDDGADSSKEIVQAGDRSNISSCHDDGVDLYEETDQADDLSNISATHDDGADSFKETVQAGDLSNISGCRDDGADSSKEIVQLDNGFSEPERSVDDVGDKNCDKENEEKLIRVADAKKLQLKLIDQFMNENDGASVETKTFNTRWEELVRELNLLGPPPLTETQWR